METNTRRFKPGMIFISWAGDAFPIANVGLFNRIRIIPGHAARLTVPYVFPIPLQGTMTTLRECFSMVILF